MWGQTPIGKLLKFYARGLTPRNGSQRWLPFCYNGRVKNDEARELGQELKAVLERLRALAKQERASRSSEAEALEIAIVNLDSAIEILTD